jgi:hypothetical protein
MAIARKPNRAAPAVDVDALIQRGGTPGKTAGDEARTTPILLRLPAGLLERLDAALKDRPIRQPRHTWILEAIYEKLTREASDR